MVREERPLGGRRGRNTLLCITKQPQSSLSNFLGNFYSYTYTYTYTNLYLYFSWQQYLFIFIFSSQQYFNTLLCINKQPQSSFFQHFVSIIYFVFNSILTLCSYKYVVITKQPQSSPSNFSWQVANGNNIHLYPYIFLSTVF